MDKILEKLNTQLKLEKDSIELYDSFIQKIDKEEIKNRISAIRNDEIKHVELVEEMIKLIESAKNIIVNEKKEEQISIQGFLEDFSSTAVIVPLEKYPQTIADIISQLQMPCIYLSFNKMANYTKKMLESKKIDISKVKFATCINGSDDSISEPGNLTGLSIGLERMMKFDGKFYLFIDSLSAFTTYHSIEDIQKFVSFTNSKMQGKNAGVIWMIIKDENESIASKIGQLCDKTIKI